MIAVILCVACLLGLLGVGQLALSGPDAIERDGLARGRPAPSWSLPDTDGRVRTSPPGLPLQLIVFADHSLRSFPSVAAGLRALRADPAGAQELEIVILTRGAAEHSREPLAQLGLDGIPVVTGSPRLYGRYNVRVMPFVIFVGADGLVRASSLVNEDWQLAKLRRIATLPVEPAQARQLVTA
ncbi:MAG TPA: hypothetical protein VF834_14535 [Streptosporangiaceae bacterium]